MTASQASSERVDPAATRHHFIIGQDETGHWLAVEAHRLNGGIFLSREEAIRYVAFETGHQADAYELSAAPLSLFS
ncbi:hypothetical protein P7D22_11275 [Lichenihabitans sp. Uapishka_5]|uniref:hypothetical protein n=1 Tax=Lichenihabitans sp. Uapishka_5 TaxID=3037302 RepID=UPI0029E810C9|nr:hypothetical protein [Lichenihabitans sp. Uapishka_5]MDX7951749.1 hypothetical protein [Lichenihabitans sp. Uapishka_5]